MSAPTPSTAVTGVVMHAVNQAKFLCQVKHGPSGATIQTEAPKDNGGTGASFSPTDLVAAALATCMLTSMQLFAAREGLPWGEASATVEKRMTPPPRRIGELVVEVTMPAGLDAQQRTTLEEVARHCPVARSLSAELTFTHRFSYPD